MPREATGSVEWAGLPPARERGKVATSHPSPRKYLSPLPPSQTPETLLRIGGHVMRQIDPELRGWALSGVGEV
jgi:hypothetical protein